MSIQILAFAEVRDGKFKKSAQEVTTAAASLAASLGGTVTVLALSAGPVADAGSLGRFGANEVLVGNDPSFATFSADVYAKAVADCVKQRDAKVVLLPHSAVGKDLAPRLSALLDCAQISDAIDLSTAGGAIQVTRPVYAGKARMTAKSTAGRTLVTLRPNVFTPKATGSADAPVSTITPNLGGGSKLKLVQVVEPQGEKRIELTEADTIVSGGRGLKAPEHFALLEKLASVLGAALGASRAVVDAGWRSHSEQVGQTGKTVSPNLYFAIGISGAIQHLAGMSSSRVIVAINKDKDAPIFKIANYGLVGDVFEVLPALTEALAQAKAHH